MIARRGLLGAIAVAPLALVALRSAAQTAPCVNLAALPAGQKGMRRSLAFELESTDPKRRCGTCAFFTATAGACGTCKLFSGGAVGAVSVCDGWAAKG